MAFWKKNPNEVAYVEGKKHWLDVIKNSGEANLLLWKQPEEDFNNNSTLIVMPGEKALFVHNGQVEQVFEPGQYKLTTENYPFLSRIRTQFSGGISTYNCVVYFVRDAHSREINWGLAPALQVRDPMHQIMCKIRINGAYKVSIGDPTKFLMHMVGGNKTSFSENELQEYFGSEMQMNIRALITQFIKSSNSEVLGICEYQIELSHLIKPFLWKAMAEYGLSLENFTIAAMDIPDDDPNRVMLENAYAQHASLKVLGEDWARLESAKILEKLAENPGAGGMGSMGAGMGMAMAAAPVFANLAQQMFGNAPSVDNRNEPSAPAPFGSGFGTPASNAQPTPAPIPAPTVGNDFGAGFAEAKPSVPVENDFEKSMQKLKFLHDNGMISQEAYDAKIQEIMSRM